MKIVFGILATILIVSLASFSHASDPSPLQVFCVAVKDSAAPEGLIHFQVNVGKTNAISFAGLSSQNPGVITIANAVFGSDPTINPDVLAKAFQVEKNVIDSLLQAQS
ncbi:hypothetical protein RD792_001303 [Penstemon davidsonii]|uniref:Germin-like protein n=1 Tax=Penstemon davidsonii TaxID=160366 RepID=A0ABR0DNQ1_9LAMI|nr:hypothetical protein RD792_001303 [Penstemon davidsonii]